MEPARSHLQNEIAQKFIEPNTKVIELRKIKTGSYRPVTQYGTKLIEESISKIGLNHSKCLLVLQLQEQEGEYEYECLGGNHRLAVFKKMNILEYPCLFVSKDKELSPGDKAFLCYWDNGCNQTFEEGDFQRFERLYTCLKDDKYWIFPSNKPKTEHSMINQYELLKTLHPNEWYKPKLSSTLVPLAKIFLEDWWNGKTNDKAFLAWKKLHDQYGEGFITCRTLTHIATFRKLSSIQREMFFVRVAKMYETVDNKQDRKSYETLEKIMDTIMKTDNAVPKKTASKPTKEKRKRGTPEKSNNKKKATSVKKSKGIARKSTTDDDSDDDINDSAEDTDAEQEERKHIEPFKRYVERNGSFIVSSYLDIPFDSHQMHYMNRKFSLIIFDEQDFQLYQNVFDNCLKDDADIMMISSVSKILLERQPCPSFDFFEKKGLKSRIVYSFYDQGLVFSVLCSRRTEDLGYQGAKFVRDFSEAEERHQLEYGNSIPDLPVASWEQLLKRYDGDILNLHPMNGTSICAAINLHKNMLCHEKNATVRASIQPHLSKRILDLCSEEHVVWYNNNNRLYEQTSDGMILGFEVSCG